MILNVSSRPPIRAIIVIHSGNPSPKSTDLILP
jgi:hypothetical protein